MPLLGAVHGRKLLWSDLYLQDGGLKEHPHLGEKLMGQEEKGPKSPGKLYILCLHGQTLPAPSHSNVASRTPGKVAIPKAVPLSLWTVATHLAIVRLARPLAGAPSSSPG